MLAGGGARGAYEAGVLAHLFEHVLPRLPAGRRLDLFSGTSVGAIHAAYGAASAHWDPVERAGRIAGIWKLMRADTVFQLSVGDLVRLPMRALGLMKAPRRGAVLGGIVDVRPLEHLVATRIPWDALPGNLASGAVGALCVSCTEIRSGHVTVFMDGALSDPSPWQYDPSAAAIASSITERHVRASAAIPFLFPAVQVDDRYYVDGGLRMNTPLSPALRLGADRVLVVATRQHEALRPTPNYPDEVITQPSFLLGKVLDALTLDQLEVELHRAELINAMIERGTKVYGDEFLDRINVAVREQRGVGFRKLRSCVIRPSEDIGRIAADVHRAGALVREVGLLHDMLARLLARGGPEDEADLLSYVFFDKRFTERLVEMGRADARTHEADMFALLAD
ncbi:MAG TPA: patatin-like phospholipase family protein [Myxococcota bacterium]|nr:patatin-like phospholipase family protein [Myxococcota bacterium]